MNYKVGMLVSRYLLKTFGGSKQNRTDWLYDMKGLVRMNINPSTLRNFRRDFAEAMAALQEKYDVTISIGNISYNPNEFYTRLTIKNGRDKDMIARADFDRDVWRYEHLGLSEGMYNRIFIGRDGKTYALKGFNTRSPKYPLLVYSVTGLFRSGSYIEQLPGFLIIFPSLCQHFSDFHHIYGH